MKEKKKYDVNVCAVVSRETKENLHRIKTDLDVSESHLIRRIINQYLENMDKVDNGKSN